MIRFLLEQYHKGQYTFPKAHPLCNLDIQFSECVQHCLFHLPKVSLGVSSRIMLLSFSLLKYSVLQGIIMFVKYINQFSFKSFEYPTIIKIYEVGHYFHIWIINTSLMNNLQYITDTNENMNTGMLCGSLSEKFYSLGIMTDSLTVS